MIRVVLADDHLMVRSGIRALLEKAGDFMILGEAGDGVEAVELVEKLHPDVLVMDIMMPHMNGIQAAARLQKYQGTTQIVLLSMYGDPVLIHQALKNGIKGYVLKSSVSDELILAIRAAARRETFLSSPISSILLEESLNSPSKSSDETALDILSPREIEILQLIVEEYTSNEIAKMLDISEKTVEKHRSNLMEKLKVKNIAGLVRKAIQYRIIDEGQQKSN